MILLLEKPRILLKEGRRPLLRVPTKDDQKDKEIQNEINLPFLYDNQQQQF